MTRHAVIRVGIETHLHVHSCQPGGSFCRLFFFHANGNVIVIPDRLLQNHEE